METPPSQDSPKHILNILNDDCIQSILHRITYPQDFLSAAETCTRFQSNAIRCFRTKYKNIGIANTLLPDFRIGFLHMSTPDFRIEVDDTYFIPHVHSNRFLSIFGNFVESILFQNAGYEPDVSYADFNLETASLFCGKVLKKLKITRCDLVDFNILQPFLALEEFELDSSKVWNFKDCSKLKKLQMSGHVFEYDGHEPLNNWMNQRFPQLEEVILNSLARIKDSLLIDFLTLNPQLKTLEILNCRTIISSVLINIGSRVPNLEKLVINLPVGDCVEIEQHVVHIGELRKLRSFHIAFSDVLSTNILIDTIIKNNIPIDDFGLLSYNENNTETLHSVLELKTLKKLSLGTVYEKLFIAITQQMTSLNELTVRRCKDISGWSIKKALEYGKNLTLLEIQFNYYSEGAYFKMDAENYNSILALAKNRVKIVIDSPYIVTDIPKDVFDANRQWIEINEHCWDK